ncbi:MAG: transglutaminase-like cysteine peptidase [Rhizobiaceae bacterium]|nr:transglutaminase-like cysteine peptidase [Rhizobiaceae bacterium]
MKNSNKYCFHRFSRAFLLSFGLVGSTVSVANAADAAPPPGLEGSGFLGGLRIAEQASARPAPAHIYRAYDAEAIGRYLQQPAHNPGIDPIQTAAIIPGVFRSFAIPMKNFPVSARWAPIYRAIGACVGTACQSKSPAFAKIVQSARQMGFLAKLEKVNRGVNELITYRRDKATYGSLDHWAKPSEILTRGAGDCEDFAILKMAALMDAGVPPQSMSLVVLQDSQKGVFHAVLSVTTGSGIFILDNVRDSVVKDISLPSHSRMIQYMN